MFLVGALIVLALAHLADWAAERYAEHYGLIPLDILARHIGVNFAKFLAWFSGFVTIVALGYDPQFQVLDVVLPLSRRIFGFSLTIGQSLLCVACYNVYRARVARRAELDGLALADAVADVASHTFAFPVSHLQHFRSRLTPHLSPSLSPTLPNETH